MTSRPIRRLASLLMTASALAGCAIGPDYVRPSAPLSATFKEAPVPPPQGWVPPIPADTLARGEWWTLFGDPVLNALAAKVTVSNQNIAAAEAAYRQARALVSEQRAALFPTVSLDAGATRSGSSGSNSSGAGTTVINPDGSVTDAGGVSGLGASSRRSATTYRVSIGASWEPDVWGRIRRSLTAAKATAQASEADLANARLAAQGELAVDYFSLRETDAAADLVQATVAGYRRSLQIATNRFNAGIAPHSDVLQAQTQLDNALADEAGLEQQRANYEHAIAVLTGQAPGDFSLPKGAWTATVPEVPVGVPSTLLQRRPDIASADRRLAAASEQIGIAQSAFFPDFNLTGSYGSSGARLASLFDVSTWSAGLTGALTLFDAGARRARVSQARAAYDEALANYRQTVLTALQDVEDQLVAARVLARQYDLRRSASASADQAEQMVLNQYTAGTVGYTEVVTAQAAAATARQAYIQAAANRQITAVALIQGIGGGWTTTR
jgi:NodT family efflux transporter outer membrane factor (OMF) lipoprotein